MLQPHHLTLKACAVSLHLGTRRGNTQGFKLNKQTKSDPTSGDEAGSAVGISLPSVTGSPG